MADLAGQWILAREGGERGGPALSWGFMILQRRLQGEMVPLLLCLWSISRERRVRMALTLVAGHAARLQVGRIRWRSSLQMRRATWRWLPTHRTALSTPCRLRSRGGIFAETRRRQEATPLATRRDGQAIGMEARGPAADAMADPLLRSIIDHHVVPAPVGKERILVAADTFEQACGERDVKACCCVVPVNSNTEVIHHQFCK